MGQGHEPRPLRPRLILASLLKRPLSEAWLLIGRASFFALSFLKVVWLSLVKGVE